MRWSLIAALMLVLVSAGGARAACADPPAPQVDWSRCSIDGLDLAGSDLTAARLRELSAIRARLGWSDFAGADLYRAKLIRADLIGARMEGARLVGADLTGADLSGADLARADLRQAQMQRAKLVGANLRDAILAGSEMLHADFSGAIWIDGRICRMGSEGRCN